MARASAVGLLTLLLGFFYFHGCACQKEPALVQSAKQQFLDLQCLRGMAIRLMETCPNVVDISARDALSHIYSVTNEELSQCASFEPLRVSNAVWLGCWHSIMVPSLCCFTMSWYHIPLAVYASCIIMDACCMLP